MIGGFTTTYAIFGSENISLIWGSDNPFNNKRKV
jgi:hypothetical protein